MGMIQEFKKFALRGNVIDMAVGIIIGGAFGLEPAAGGVARAGEPLHGGPWAGFVVGPWGVEIVIGRRGLGGRAAQERVPGEPVGARQRQPGQPAHIVQAGRRAGHAPPDQRR